MLSDNTALFFDDIESSIALSNFILSINKASSVKNIYASLALCLPDLILVDRCSVTLLNPERTELEVFSLHGSEGALPIGKSMPLNSTYVGKAIKKRMPILHIIAPNCLLIDGQLLYQQGIKSLINAPLIISGEVIGSVNIGSKSVAVFNQNTLDLMSLVVTLLSTYLERQTLLEKTRVAMLGYRHYSTQLEVLNQCAENLSTAVSDTNVFKVILHSIESLIPAKQTCFISPTGNKSAFNVKYLCESTQPLPDDVFPAQEDSILNTIMQEGEPRFIADFKNQQYLEHKLLAEFGLVSGWSIPIYAQQQITGILFIATEEAINDGEKLKDLFVVMGSMMGAALERLIIEKRLQYQAHHDSLTGLPNRTQLYKKLNQHLTENETASLALLFIDLDNFKSTNDSLGHDIGDSLLCSVTQRMASVMPSNHLMARLGGDEFIIILPNINDKETAAQLSVEIIDALQSLFIIKGHKLFIGASIGISLYPEHSTQAADLIKFADIAMYNAKKQGRNNCQFFSQTLSDQINHQQNIDNALHHAISKDELHLMFQPLINGDEMQGIEALLRWTHSEMGSISPAEFIPIAEESLIIEDITYWVLERSLATLKRLRRHQKELFVAVNISAKIFSHSKDFVQIITAALQRHKLPFSALELEITENVFLHNLEPTKRIMNELRDKGIRIAIDDFGTGFSSLTYLLDLPLDTLKIDQSFVQGIESDNKKLGVVKAIVALSKSLQLSCIAEGIETEAQKNCLQNLGCERFQGYFFSRPLPESELEKMMLSQITYS
ncbi:MAG: diguanylate cyclase (GGDEF)-like protein [Colwellia sp.]|jgi:diguanylate cyclase (GGDEF)-like protein